jgi:hypothetical protein
VAINHGNPEKSTNMKWTTVGIPSRIQYLGICGFLTFRMIPPIAREHLIAPGIFGHQQTTSSAIGGNFQNRSEQLFMALFHTWRGILVEREQQCFCSYDRLFGNFCFYSLVLLQHDTHAQVNYLLLD